MLPSIVGVIQGAGAPPVAPNSYESIATVNVGVGGSATAVFSSISSGYSHLQVRGIWRSDLTSSGNNIGLYMRINGDTGSNYYWHEVYGNGSSAGAYSQADTGIIIDGHGPRSGDTANSFATAVIDILDYTNTNKTKVVRALNGDDLNGSGWVALNSGLWNNTAAITSLTLFVESSNLTQFSQFALYGVK